MTWSLFRTLARPVARGRLLQRAAQDGCAAVQRRGESTCYWDDVDTREIILTGSKPTDLLPIVREVK